MLNPSGQDQSPPGSTAVLLSGGLDSAVVLALLSERNVQVQAVWVDYGQRPAGAERAASRALAAHFEVSWLEVRAQAPPIPPAGEIPGRNDLLVAMALAAVPLSSVAIGIHAGTPYPDTTEEWARSWQEHLELQHRGRRQLVAPLVTLNKREVFNLATELRIPVNQTFSCETNDSACGTCPSCEDRSVIDASAKS